MPNKRFLELAKRLGNKDLPKEKTKKEIEKEEQKIILPASTDIQNPVNYIILEGKNHMGYSYDDLLVAKQKSHFNKNWSDTHKALHQENASMLTIRQFADFLNLLRTGKAYDGKGNKINSNELKQIYNEIAEVRSPWRSEWLDASFKDYNGKLYINYDHIIDVKGEIKQQVSKPLEACLMKDKTPGISLDDWLSNANKQGLPGKRVKKGKLWYWHPRENHVAWFWADSDRAYLNCGRNPDGSDSSLGVRAIAKRAKN